MDNIYQEQEAYEVDPNSSFNKLKKLQLALKEEVALNEIYFENRDNLLKKIEKNCFEYFQKRMSIQEIYDHGTISLTESGENKKKLKYIVSEKPQNELTQCFDPLYKLMFYFRESNELLLKLIQYCPKENFEQLSNILCHCFFVNIFSSSFLNENLLTLIYLLLEKEVENISSISSFVTFLDQAQNFTALLLKSLARKDEVKVYLEKILKKLLIRTSGMLRRQNNNLFIELNISRISTILKDVKYNFERTEKQIDSIKDLITSNINKSKLNLIKKKSNVEDKSQIGQDNSNILNKTEIENNIWVQVTKETFDDLLLGNEAKDNFDDIFSNKKTQSKNNNNINDSNKDDLENYFINSGYFIKKENEESNKKDKLKSISLRQTMLPMHNTKAKLGFRKSMTFMDEMPEEKDILDYKKTSDKNILEKINEEETKENTLIPKQEQNKEDINELYSKELDKETLLDLLDKQTNKDMEEYIINQIRSLEKEDISFSNEKLINEISKSSRTEKTREKIALAFKYNFECIKEFLDEIFFSLINNIDNIPYIIRAVCTILAKLIKIKFPKITTIQIIPFLSEFIFSNLIFPILVNPKNNGIMMFDFNKDKKLYNERNKKIIAMNKVLKKLLRGQLYDSSGNDYAYTLFNSYFIEIMPYVIDFFTNLTCVKLPANIEQLLEEKQKLNASILNESATLKKEEVNPELKESPTNNESNPNIANESKISKEFNFLKMHPEERIEHQSLCLNYKDILMIYNIIKNNEIQIVGDPEGIVYKTYKKLSFHEESIKKKIEKEENEGKKTFICMTKLVMDEKLKEKINEKKDKKFSFQESESMDDSNKEIFILKRIKYSINTIIKHLNILKRTNFYMDENESTENFVIGLNKMISMEGFSEMLKEKKLPLEWFGLYLQSNIENIPENYRKDNYALLYNELIKESMENLEKIKNDDSLNIIYNKIINSEKMIDISSNGLKRITNNTKKFEIFFFILKIEIPVTIVIHYKKNSDKISYIELEKKDLQVIHKKKLLFSFFKEDLNMTDLKKYECKSISEFCDSFPSLQSEILDCFNYEEEVKLTQFLEEYFKITNEYVMKEEMFSGYEEEEKKNIQQQIENYIHAQIYNKIFTSNPSENDIKIKTICEKHKNIKASNINEKVKYDDEKMVQIMIHFVENMENEMSPANKIHEFEIIDMIINNIIDIYGYDQSYYNSLLLYVFIKANPKIIDSTLKYINIFLNNDLKMQYDGLIKKMKNLVKSLSEFGAEEKNKNFVVENYFN